MCEFRYSYLHSDKPLNTPKATRWVTQLPTQPPGSLHRSLPSTAALRTLLPAQRVLLTLYVGTLRQGTSSPKVLQPTVHSPSGWAAPPEEVKSFVPVWGEAQLMPRDVGAEGLVAPVGTGGTQQQLGLHISLREGQEGSRTELHSTEQDSTDTNHSTARAQRSTA